MEQEAKKDSRKRYFTGSRIAKIAIFSAISAVLYIIPGIPLGSVFASWLELRFFDIPTLIGTFALGPVAGCITVVVRILLKLMIMGTTTGFVGELGDLLCGLAFILPAGLLYRKDHTFRGALVGSLIGMVCSIAIAVLVNRFLLIPFFAGLSFVGGMDGLVGMVSGIYPDVTVDSFYRFYLWLSVVPFNLIRCGIAILVTMFSYKRISFLLKKF